MKLREWLKNKRLDNGLTQEKVAKAVDINRSYYNMIENGARTPRPILAKRIGELLSLDWTRFYDS